MGQRAKPPACILERFINIGHKLSSDCSQTSAILAPDPQSVTLVGIGQPLVDQPGVQKCGRQTPKTDHFETVPKPDFPTVVLWRYSSVWLTS